MGGSACQRIGVSDCGASIGSYRGTRIEAVDASWWLTRIERLPTVGRHRRQMRSEAILGSNRCKRPQEVLSGAFWFVRIDNITELFTAVYETGRFPISAYPGWMRGILTFVIPIAFITTFPAAAVLGRVNSYLLPVSLLIAGLLFCCSVLFWRFAVRCYSSASS